MVTASVKNKKTNQQGHIFHFSDSVIDSKKQYYARFKGDGGGYVGGFYKGSELELLHIYNR